MGALDQGDAPGGERQGGLASYVAVWVIAGALVALAAVLMLDRGRDGSAPASVHLPPVHDFQLERAARRGGCSIVARHPRRPIAALTVLGAGAGIYERPIPAAARARSVRAGLIVIEYRSGLPAPAVAQLAAVQRAVPVGTVLAPSATLRRSEMSVTSYRRQLRCPAVGPRAIDALQLFRGRYVGSGPDGP